MEKYIIKESETGNIFHIIDQKKREKIAKFETFTEGLEFIKKLFESYIKQKDRSDKEEYESLVILLNKLTYLFTVLCPPLYEEDEGENTEDLLVKISRIYTESIHLRARIEARFLWYSQKIIGPLSCKVSLDSSFFIGIQLREADLPQVFKELYEAENFLVQELHKETITQDEYDRLDKNVCKIFSEIQGN